MRVIPVIDLQGGQVVRGVGGQRDQYRPVQSQLVNSVVPGEVAAALISLGPHRELYIADLDAIGGAVPSWQAYDQAFHAGARPMIDAGLRTPAAAETLVDFLAQRSGDADIVVALESSAGPEHLRDVFARIGSERAVFSLDLKGGQPLTSADRWQGQTAMEIAARAVEIGFRRIIVLDLAAVGTGSGPSVVDLCGDLHRRHPMLELISGGGVRAVGDLRLFADAGCAGVLVASALHDGRITRADLEECDFL